MAKVLCVLYDDPVGGYPKSYPIDTLPVGVLFPCLLVVAVFPLTLGYVSLVDRAMDVRVAIRQGLRYAVTRGAIRVVVALFMAGVLWNAWNLVNDPSANRPRKLQAIAFGVVAAVLVPKFAKRAFDSRIDLGPFRE